MRSDFIVGGIGYQIKLIKILIPLIETNIIVIKQLFLFQNFGRFFFQ